MKNFNMKKIKFYNKSESIGYAPIPQLSPYAKISTKRLKKTKFYFRQANKYINHFIKKPQTWLDVGTANGEFLYYLAKKWKKTEFKGLDITYEFLKVARIINKNYKNVSFHCSDVLRLNEKKFSADVVTCLGTLPIFPNPKKILNKLLNLVNKRGILLVDGRFNTYDISAQIKYKDDSKKISENLWRCDYNLHSEKWIKKILSFRSDINKIYFKYPVMDAKIPRKKNAPDINNWTVPLKNGGFEITNGMKISINPSYLIIKKK